MTESAIIVKYGNTARYQIQLVEKVMKIDENEFFRQATLHICGNLEIEAALFNSLKFLRKEIPVDRIYLQLYEKGQNAMRTVAVATEREGKTVDLLTPLSDEARQEMMQYQKEYLKQKPDYVWLFRDDPHKQMMTSETFNYHGARATSLMVMPLGIDDKVVGGGSLLLATEGDNKFTQQHADLLSLLKYPFAIAMSNALKHRSELKLHGREFFWAATIRICGNLEIEEALFSTFQLLRQSMPVDWMAIAHYDEGSNSMRTIATADQEEGKSIDLLTPLSDKAQNHWNQKQSTITQKVHLFDEPEKVKLGREMLHFHGIEATSLLVLALGFGGRRIGTLALVSRSAERFSQKHAELLSMLSEPFSLALSNTLKHRSELKLHDREFFMEATRRICGNLNIEEAMFSTLSFLRQSMPATIMFLERYDESSTATRTIAKATLDKGESLDLLAPLSPAAQKWAKGYITDNTRRIYYYDNPHERPLASEMMRFHNISLSSVILLPLVTGEQVVGSLIIGSETDDMLTQEHADRILLLSEPFAVAMSNALKHRSELKLHDREFFWEATMRICGNLEIEEGLRATIEFLSKHMPADRIYLERHEIDHNAMNFVAQASAEKGEKMDALIPFSEQAKAAMQEMWQAWEDGLYPEVKVINNPDGEPLTTHLLKSLNEPSSSVMSLPLIVEDQLLGSLVLLAEGYDRFKEDHARLFANLKVPFFVAMSNILKHREIIKLKDLLADDNRYLHGELRRLHGDEIIGANFGLRNVMHKVQHVAALGSPVLLLGETGVGKDVIANTIHYSSSRSDGPFVSVNCGAIPDTLIDSELFGHEKGAFTGALSQKRGRFERADKGTIFLDEIGELPPHAQVRLLRVLQSKEIERVGGDKTVQLNIRIIAATNRNLEEMVRQGKFREDLWFRLNVFPVWIPPLRDRTVDIPALLQHFINMKRKELNMPVIPELSPGAVDSLMQYHWPGNVRELENIVERALILNHGGPLAFDKFIQSEEKETTAVSDQSPVQEKLDEVIFSHIQKVLSKTKGKVHGSGGAADLLGINPSTLRNRMNKLGINYGRGK
jgi:transcriptional regulator with GAF, ATPase, and Fis domain